MQTLSTSGYDGRLEVLERFGPIAHTSTCHVSSVLNISNSRRDDDRVHSLRGGAGQSSILCCATWSMDISLLLEWDCGSTSCAGASLRHRIILRRQKEFGRGGSIEAMNSRGRKNAVHQMKASHHGLCNQGGEIGGSVFVFSWKGGVRLSHGHKVNSWSVL
jgi:hypothetical protein